MYGHTQYVYCSSIVIYTYSKVRSTDVYTITYITDSHTLSLQQSNGPRVLRCCVSSPCRTAKNSSPIYFIWCECNIQMRTVNLLVDILMTYLVRLFYEHSTLKLLLKILLSLSKKSSFERFCTRWLKYYIALKLQVTFNLGLNAAKNKHPIKKFFK